MDKNEYNNEPVYYCSRCLSLRIREFDTDDLYCDECGNTHIESTNIENWEQMYKDKYNVEFLNKDYYGKRKKRI